MAAPFGRRLPAHWTIAATWSPKSCLASLWKMKLQSEKPTMSFYSEPTALRDLFDIAAFEMFLKYIWSGLCQVFKWLLQSRHPWFVSASRLRCEEIHVTATNAHGSAVSPGLRVVVIINIIISARASRKLLKMKLEVCTTQLFPLLSAQNLRQRQHFWNGKRNIQIPRRT